MAEHAKLAYQQWREADALARKVEQELAQAWERFHARQGPAPSAELMQEVSRLRAISNAKLSAAREAMKGSPPPANDPDFR